MARVAILLCVFLVVVPSFAKAVGSGPRVWLSDKSPLVVRGSGFKAHEHITVTVTAAGRHVRSVTAGAGGTFVARWASGIVVKHGCVTIAIEAVGSRGTVAARKVPGLECAQGPTDPGP